MRDREQGSKGPRRRLARALRRAFAAAGAVLAIASCGDLSLVKSLRQEAPGALRFSPPDPVIPTGTVLTFTVKGGISPYNLVSGAVTSVDGDTWEFTAPASVNGDSQDFPIQFSDWAGTLAESTVRVYSGAGPQLKITGVTLPVGATWTFEVAAGTGVAPYSWEVDGVAKATGSSYSFSSLVTGTYVITVIDSVGVSQVATATVVSNVLGGPLTITPTSAVTVPGGSVAFTALGGSGSYQFSASAGTIVDSNPATFIAPPATGKYTRAITLTDTGGGLPSPLYADATVTSSGALLLITPNSVTVSVVGDTVQFSASGGTPPNTYFVNRADFGSIDAAGLYTQLDTGPVLVTVTDKDGLTDKATVKWKPQ